MSSRAAPRTPLPHQEVLFRALEKQIWRYFRAWRDDDVTDLCDRLIRMAPDRSWPYYMLAETAFRRSNWEAALKHYKRAVALGRQEPETMLRAGESAMKLRRVQEAARWMAAAAAHPRIDPLRKRNIEAFLARITRR